ncbi:rhodanese-like domain-containing protein [Fodinibius salsisoli]|uniref:Rhodanese-like domain-containing protein n=1 Tax=Fodinibius salsisoli TaxID=2820877 RepID=A0ABT3PLN2_9BACT|nr:rhodanese-like domain-containing protein [Fodinibius salsisoli]MCW9706864.1 rhodanese-like domain-containing protein [Fodinibius salsisoli]
MEEITVEQLKQKIDDQEGTFVLDVREPFEKYQSDINYDQSTLIPLGELASRIDEIEDKKDKEIVCMCRSGGRSAEACKILGTNGFSNVKNLKGGINEWARKIDTSLPVY